MVGVLSGGAHPRSRGENAIGALIAGLIYGSSPLTRGKPCDQPTQTPITGLIPAHAGKTRHSTADNRASWAHPRSRGENNMTAAPHCLHVGSSPLTRGKPGEGGARRSSVGLIPAHAGKTLRASLSSALSRAHPRSRGENTIDPGPKIQHDGSSPLTRGKPCGLVCGPHAPGLIPAHAGKTWCASSRPQRSRAHPRSRGENSQAQPAPAQDMGSSPLTRGKRRGIPARTGGGGLIPAPAGKTKRRLRTRLWTRAHPRSRGENVTGLLQPCYALGSSPLPRGKQAVQQDGSGGPGLIPAPAGKTAARCADVAIERAHPRSRGENQQAAIEEQKAKGSSPLPRGKRQYALRFAALRGLIPAPAGKTDKDNVFAYVQGAHPRSRGENAGGRASRVGARGSSPLPRGKLVIGLWAALVSGLIPAPAGKTVSLACW